MERKRAYLEVARDILNVARTGARPTQLVYRANLNFNVIKRYVAEMEEAGLLAVKGIEPRIYTTTQKGIEFIESLNRTLEIYHSPIPLGTIGVC